MALTSDTFDSDLSLWNQYDPVGDCSFGIGGGIATISIPSDALNGGQHNLWTSDVSAPRLEQSCADADLDVYVEILDVPQSGSTSDKYTGFGMIVTDSSRNNIVRVDLNGSTSPFLFGATVTGGVGGTTSTKFNVSSPPITAPYLFRIRRTKATNAWTISYSVDDGATWTTPSGGTFTYSMTAAIVAIAVNNGNSLAVTGRFGRFVNLLASTTTPVSASRTMTWRVRDAITANRSATWRVRQAAGDSRTTTWRVRVNASQQRSMSWRVRQVVQSVRHPLWRVRKAVEQSRTATWRVRSTVTTTRTALWRVLANIPTTTVTVMREMSWRVRESVSAERTAVWRVRQGIASSRSMSWRTRALVTVQRALSWRVKVVQITKAIVVTFGRPVSRWRFGRTETRWHFGRPKSDGRD